MVAAKVLSFEDALKLVSIRANAMQEACEKEPSTMAAILGLEDDKIEAICSKIDGVVVPANYNCPGQVVISGSVSAIEEANEQLLAAGARRALVLNVGGAFHSPLMQPAEDKLKTAILATDFNTPICPIVQNVNAEPNTDAKQIKQNLIKQLTSPVKWTQTMHKILELGADEIVEVGPGKVLTGLFKKVDRSLNVVKL